MKVLFRDAIDWTPPTDAWEEEWGYAIKIDVPGVDRIQITARRGNFVLNRLTQDNSRLKQPMSQKQSGSSEGRSNEPPQGTDFDRMADIFSRGITSGDVNITITGRRKEDKGDKEKGQTYWTRERPAGTFRREFSLPGYVDVSHIGGEVHNGVLYAWVSQYRDLTEEEKRKLLSA